METLMHKFDANAISQQPINIALLEVLSFEMNVYLVRLTTSDNGISRHGLVFDSKTDKPFRFHNSASIREFFADCHVEQAVMVHDTPYDEMINNPPKAKNPMALPFSMTLPY